MRRFTRFVVALLSATLLIRCSGRGVAAGDPGVTVSVLDLVDAGGTVSPTLHFPAPPRLQRVASGLHWRDAIVTEPGTWTWDVTVPASGRLHLGFETFARAGSRGDPPPLELTVAVIAGGRRKAIYVASPRELDAPDWLDLELPLDRWEGEAVRIELSTVVVGEPDRRAAPAELAWSPARVVAPGETSPSRAPAAAAEASPALAALQDSEAPPSRPSILLIVIDTLRADYLTPYGASRWNSPNITEKMAKRGVIFENAYSQAPWTLPSMISLVTGVVPGVLLGSQAGTFAIPPEQPTLPEQLSRAGYETAAFIANPTMHQGNGFGRGLDDLYISPPETAFVTLEDELLVRKATSWLRARGGRPFYLHVHFLAPHDPYSNPVQFLGRSPSRPFYLGRITGADVHDLFLGTLELDDPDQDVPHLKSLYASEVRWVDRWVGELLDALPPERARDTLVVLTSDHGEELYDHGSWKHGRTLYQEQLRVPLLARWDGTLAARRRVAAPVRLIDVTPTLLQAAGVRASGGSSSGRSLLPELLGGSEPAPEDVYAERLNFGPMQAAVVSHDRKLILFDLYGSAPLADRMQEQRVEEEALRQPRIALYDLERDPYEQHNLAASAPDLLRRLLPGLHRGLDRTTPGLRVLAGHLPAGSRLDVVVRFTSPPAEWRSYFLGGSDGAVLDGRELRLALASDVIEKGVLVLGGWGGIEAIEARLDGQPVDPSRIWSPIGARSGTAPGSKAVAARSRILDAASLAGESPDGTEATGPAPPLVYLWVPASGSSEPAEGRPDAETLHRLRALGYL